MIVNLYLPTGGNIDLGTDWLVVVFDVHILFSIQISAAIRGLPTAVQLLSNTNITLNTSACSQGKYYTWHHGTRTVSISPSWLCYLIMSRTGGLLSTAYLTLFADFWKYCPLQFKCYNFYYIWYIHQQILVRSQHLLPPLARHWRPCSPVHSH